MANTFVKSDAWSSVLQSVLRESFVGKYIADTKFEGEFDGNDTVHFPRLAKVSVSALATSYSSVTPQDVTEADETFTLDKRFAFAVQISDEDYKELYINPDSRIIRDAAEAFAKEYDTEIMKKYASAGILVRDGDMATASNGGGTNKIILSKSNIYDMITAVAQKLDEAKVPDSGRFIILSPKEKRLLASAPELLRSTNLGDKTVTGGFMGTVDNISIYWSNNLQTVSTVKHLIAGQGKPICFAANIKPKVQFVGSETQATNFVNTLKGQTKFGVKVFTEGAERLVDIQVA